MLNDCLPRKLLRYGYQTIAVHGYVDRMFDRDMWYPRIGFERMLFRSEFRSLGLTECTDAFTGICDSQISEWIAGYLLKADTPTFIHWVTLNSHLPVPANLEAKLYSASCSDLGSLAASVALCNWYRLERRLHESIVTLATRKEMPDTIFIVVGDHAPPFLDLRLRSLFSQDDVPFLVLQPRLDSSKQLVSAVEEQGFRVGRHPHSSERQQRIPSNALPNH